MIRLIRWVLIGLIVVYGVAEVFSKSYLQGKIEENVRERYPVARNVDSSVSVPVVFDFLARSKVSRLEISITNIEAGEFLADRVTVTLHDIKIQRGESISRREIVLESIDKLELTVEILDTEVSKILPEGFSIEFRADEAILQGPGGLQVAAEALVATEARIWFVPKRQQGLPAGFRPPVLELAEIPLFACQKTTAEIQAGRLIVTCTSNDPPTDFPPEGSDLFAALARVG